jgi:selenide, water dikinase
VIYSGFKHLVLIGGGHTHAIALQLWGMNPLAGVHLTLITDVLQTPYSGMLPGHIAGFYSYDEIHIDLHRLANFAQAQLYLDRAVGLDLQNNKVLCANLPPVSFDYLSIDIGSIPKTTSIPGATKYAIPVKPVPKFLNAWNQLLTEATTHPEKPLSIGIVGGGAGGVELAFNMQHRLHQILLEKNNLKIHLFHQNNRLTPDRDRHLSQKLEKIWLKRGLQLHMPEIVSEIELDRVKCESGLIEECDRVFWVVQASAQSWVKESGLLTDSKGFILISDTLQSISHPHVFAAGDTATMSNHPRPKAGVFAVRQGQPLFENWRRILQGKSLKPYIPQKEYLILIGIGDKSAIASWRFLTWHSPLMWWWKDFIDRQFMNRFNTI